MKLRILAYLTLVVLILVWPPIYSYFFERNVKSLLNGRGHVEDFELQEMLNVKRWVIDIPADKDGWIIGLVTRIEGEVKDHGGCSVRGGERLVLLTRRDSETKKIYYAWHQYHDSGHSRCWGSIADPFGPAKSYGDRAEGEVKLDEPIYFGSKGDQIQVTPIIQYDYEVRVGLHK